MAYWIVEPLCNVWVLGYYCGHELAGVFFLYVAFEVLDGCGMRVFVTVFECLKGVVSVVCGWCVVGVC